MQPTLIFHALSNRSPRKNAVSERELTGVFQLTPSVQFKCNKVNLAIVFSSFFRNLTWL